MMDYASRLGAMAGGQGQTLPMGTAQTLAGDYAQFLTGAARQQGPGPGKFGLALRENAAVTPEQRSILEMIVAFYNAAGRAS